MPHVRRSVRGPKMTGEARPQFSFEVDREIRCEIDGKHSKHFVFGPRTLGRTWGTRPVPFDLRQFPLTFVGSPLTFAGSPLTFVRSL